MKVVVLGAGALGSIVGAHLHRIGVDVVLLARPPRADLLAKDGVRLSGLAEMVERVPIATDVADVGDGDVYVNALKTFDSPEVIRQLRPKAGAVGLSLQNGVYKNRELAACFGAGGVLGAAAMVSGEVASDGSVRFTWNDTLLIGEPAGGVSPRVQAIVDLLAQSGIRAAASRAIAGIEWAKYATYVPLVCLALITRQPTHRFLHHPGTASVMVELSRAMVDLATSQGVDLPEFGSGPAAITLARLPRAEAVEKVRAFGAALAQSAPQHKVSALQDLERGRRTEAEGIVGYALQLAAERSLELPVLRTCFELALASSQPETEAG